jgi:hypothetical protein
MEKMAGPFVGIAFLAALATAVYAFTLHSELMLQKAATANAEQALTTARRTAGDLGKQLATAATAQATCAAQLTDVQAQLTAKTLPRPRRTPATGTPPAP